MEIELLQHNMKQNNLNKEKASLIKKDSKLKKISFSQKINIITALINLLAIPRIMV
jgi:hypothetical protein